MSDRTALRQKLEQRTNEELISILLGRDAEPWPPEAAGVAEAILIERGTAAGKGAEIAAGRKSTLDEVTGMDLVTVAEYVSRLDAEEDRLILENEGIHAWIFEEETPPAAPTPPSVLLRVDAADWRAAMERLASEDETFPY